jgi:hypothetical protein
VCVFSPNFCSEAYEVTLPSVCPWPTLVFVTRLKWDDLGACPRALLLLVIIIMQCYFLCPPPIIFHFLFSLYLITGKWEICSSQNYLLKILHSVGWRKQKLKLSLISLWNTILLMLREIMVFYSLLRGVGVRLIPQRILDEPTVLGSYLFVAVFGMIIGKSNPANRESSWG